MDRIIGELQGEQDGPLLIFIGGLHGNESPGVTALDNVFKQLKSRPGGFKGRAIALRGNIEAIKQGTRYIDFDLNRIWDKHHFNTIDRLNAAEYDELKELKTVIEAELDHAIYDNAYLLDLHTTSAPTIPFIVTNFDNHNQMFIDKLNVPYITGLSGYLDGTILSWFCRRGNCGLAFEAGQHHSRTSIIKHEAFTMLSMHHTGFISLHQSELDWLQNILDDELAPKHQHFSLVERYHIDADENFRMADGFTNFQKIYKGEVLATNKYGEILSDLDGNIFMPLYQDQGDDGFFIIEPVSH
ncbi:MAG: succinylglutamate desuccinylase/aspartoacylase family protein [Bacteroidia bacterium]